MKKVLLLADKVENDIKRMIKEQNMDIGDKIPNETELSKLLGVSRSTIREAIRSLVSLNILEIQRGRGTFIKDFHDADNEAFGLNSYEDKNKMFNDLFEARTIIEPEIAYLAAIRATEEDKKRLRVIIDAMTVYYKQLLEDKHDVNSLENLNDADKRFHSEIAIIARNSFFERLVPLITENISEVYFNKGFKEQIYDISTNQHHSYICESICENNPEDAKKYTLEHMEYLVQYLKENLDDE